MGNDFFAGDVTEPLTDAHVEPSDNGRFVLGKLNNLIDLMTRLGPLYMAWRDHPVARRGWHMQPACGQGFQERELLEKLRGLHWGQMQAAYQRLNNLHSAAAATGAAAGRAGQRLADAWQGAASEQARAKFHDLHSAAGRYAEDLETVGAALRGLTEASRSAVSSLADFAQESGNAHRMAADAYTAYDKGKAAEKAQRVPNMPFVDQAAAVVTAGGSTLLKHIANAVFDGLADDAVPSAMQQQRTRIGIIDQLLANGGYTSAEMFHPVISNERGFFGIPITTPVTPQTLRIPLAVVLETEQGTVWASEAVNELDDFAQRYYDTMFEFRIRIERTAKQVDDLLRDFKDHVTITPDPFAKLGFTTGGGGTGGIGGPGGGGPTGGGGGSGGAGRQSPIAWNPQTDPGRHPGGMLPQPSQAHPPQSHPPQSHPLQTHPTVQPPVPAAPDHPETVRITDGDRTIQVTSPDGAGHVRLTVSEHGRSRTYDIDFGPQAPSGAPGAPHGRPDLPAALIQPDAQQPATGTVQAGVSGPADGSFGPGGGQPDHALPAQVGQPQPGQPQPGQSPAGPVEHVQPGRDGTAVLGHGPDALRVHRDPATGALRLNVGGDDQRTYTIDAASRGDSAGHANAGHPDAQPGIPGGATAWRGERHPEPGPGQRGPGQQGGR